MQQEIHFDSGRDALSGTLSTPEKETDTCVVLIAGSGMQDRDETFTKQNGTFKEISSYLVKEGIATLRYDKRGVGRSTGDFLSATIDDFTKDAESAVKFLSKKFSKIILLGHSEGGIAGTIVAARNKNVKGLILLAPANRPMDGLIEEQLQTIEKMFPGSVTPKMMEENKQWKEDIKNGVYKRYKDYYAKDSKLPEWINEANRQNPQSPEYWNSLFDLDIREEIKKVEVPMLFLNGKMDFLINHDKTKKMYDIAKQNNKNCTLRLFDNLCHRFVRVKDLKEGFNVDMGQLPDKDLKFDKDVLDSITIWVKNAGDTSLNISP